MSDDAPTPKKKTSKKSPTTRRSKSAEAVARRLEQEPAVITVRRIHRRDLNRTWEFLKKVFRDVNRTTVEYQRPRTKQRFFETYEDESVEQLLFAVDHDIVGYAECGFDTSGDDNWLNPRYFEKRDMRPLYVEELAVHPDYQGQGVGGFILDQLHQLARVRGCTHLVLEVAENNVKALSWYRKRNFFKLDAAIFLAQKVNADPELLPPRRLHGKRKRDTDPPADPPALHADEEEILSPPLVIKVPKKPSSRSSKK